MFGKYDLRELKEALDVCSCDMNCFRHWQRQYERLMKQLPYVREQYENALYTAQEVYVTVQELEQIIVKRPDREKWEFQGLIKSLKKVQNTFDHEFMISREDKEFHSTYESILRLGVKALGDEQRRLILQSEIENLLAILEENLEKEEPRFEALCFFYQEHEVAELAELTPAGRMERIEELYQSEFVQPMVQLLADAMFYADSRRDELEYSSGRRGKREAELIRVLWNRAGEELPPPERARRVVQELMSRGDEG